MASERPPDDFRDPVPPPAPPPGPPGQGFDLDRAARTLGLDPTSRILYLAGLGCLALQVLFTFLPWVSISFGNVRASASGINTTPGVFQLLLALGVGGFAAFVLFAAQRNLLLGALWAGAGWGVLASLWRLVDISNTSGAAGVGGATGIGLILSLLASLGVAGTFGVLVVKAMTRR